MRITGVDPGLDGAIVTAIYADTGQMVGVDTLVLDMPTIGVGKDRSVDGPMLNNAVREVRNGGSVHVYVERLHAMPPPKKGRPGRGTVAAWKLGVCYGRILQALDDVRMPYTLVTPQQWKKALNVAGGGDAGKENARIRALQLFPMARQHLYRVKDHNRAEALLIAEWGRRHGGQS